LLDGGDLALRFALLVRRDEATCGFAADENAAAAFEGRVRRVRCG
jgi:hypothetical protein